MDASLESLSREHEIKERNLRKMIDELQSQVERERNEKRDAITQADESRQKMIDKQSELGNTQQPTLLYIDVQNMKWLQALAISWLNDIAIMSQTVSNAIY